MTHSPYHTPGYEFVYQAPAEPIYQNPQISQPIIDQAPTQGADLSNLVFFEPILVFAAVFVILFAILMKTKLLGEQAHPWFNVLVSFVIATIFTLSINLREVVLLSIPWFAVLLIAMFLIMVLIGLIGKTEDYIGKGLGWAFIITILLIFAIATISVFSDEAIPYLPGPGFGVGAESPETLFFFSWLYSPSVVGTVAFAAVAGFVSWVLIKFPKIKKD